MEPTDPVPPSPDTRSAQRPRERWRLSSNGLVRDMSVTETERVLACAMHLWLLFSVAIGPFALLLPVVAWLIMRERSFFVADHLREVINAQLTMLILLAAICVGWVLLVPWGLVWLVAAVRGAIAAGSGEIFRYPVLIRVLR